MDDLDEERTQLCILYVKSCEVMIVFRSVMDKSYIHHRMLNTSHNVLSVKLDKRGSRQLKFGI